MHDQRNPDRSCSPPSDKPQGERGDHGNLDRPGAQAHPRCHTSAQPWAGPRPWRQG